MAFVEWGTPYYPANRINVLKESGGGKYVPEMMIDSSREWLTGFEYSDIVEYVDRSQARAVGATIQANYSRDGNVVTFKATVTNLSGVLLSSANKAAVQAIVYEDYHAQKTNRIGRGSAKTNITYLADGATDSYIITMEVENVVDWSKAHFIVLVDYKFTGTHTNTNGVYDQLQAVIATPGDVTPPQPFSVEPPEYNFTINARDTELPTGDFTVNMAPGKTWTATSNVEWMTINPASGGHGDTITVSFDKTKLVEGMNKGMVVVSETGSTRQRAGLVNVTFVIPPPPKFTVLPVSLTYTIRYDDPPGPTAGIRITGDTPQTWTAEASHDWIELGSTSGNVPATIVVTFNRAKLAPGLNEGTIIIRDGEDYHEKTVTVKITYIPEGGIEYKIFMPLIQVAE